MLNCLIILLKVYCLDSNSASHRCWRPMSLNSLIRRCYLSHLMVKTMIRDSLSNPMDDNLYCHYFLNFSEEYNWVENCQSFSAWHFFLPPAVQMSARC